MLKSSARHYVSRVYSITIFQRILKLRVHVPRSVWILNLKIKQLY